MVNGVPKAIKATREVGLVFEYNPTVGTDAHTINVSFSFESIALVQPTRKTEIRLPGIDHPLTIEQPDFQKRSVTTNIMVWDGSTVLLGVFEPFLSEKKENTGETHKVLALLTTRLVTPGGQPLHKYEESASANEKP